MKSLLFVFCLLTFAYTSYSQSAADSLFIVTYTTGSAWDTSKKPNDQSYFKEHSANLSAWRKSGVIKMGARYADKGIIIIAAEHLKAAEELIKSDQAIANNLFHADVQRLNVFYEGCVEKPKVKK